MGQTDEYANNLYERIEFVRAKVEEGERALENDMAFMFATDEDIDAYIRQLSEYARELDALESMAMGIQVERNEH